ncbi:MAG TPA: hypothetical protein VI685_23535 [Candidatus Angelobacter sp.]
MLIGLDSIMLSAGLSHFERVVFLVGVSPGVVARSNSELHAADSAGSSRFDAPRFRHCAGETLGRRNHGQSVKGRSSLSWLLNPHFLLFLLIFLAYWIVYWQEFIIRPLYYFGRKPLISKRD